MFGGGDFVSPCGWGSASEAAADAEDLQLAYLLP